MKSLTIHTLVVAVALTLWGTPSMAASGEVSSLPVSPAEKDTTSATATSAAPLYALSGLDAQTLAAQAMTDQELKAVEAGQLDLEIGHAVMVTGVDGIDSFLRGVSRGCNCSITP